MRRPGDIDPKLYRNILAVMPISCVDVVLVCHNKFLLGKRTHEPAKGTWWLIGGRVLKNEGLRKAALRKVREETGLRKVAIKRFLATESTTFKKSAFGPTCHTINSVFLAEAPSFGGMKPDNQNSELRWFSRINRRWPAYVRHMLQLSGFRQ